VVLQISYIFLLRLIQILTSSYVLLEFD